MSTGLAILSGLLGGFGQVPKSLEAMDQNERERQRLAQQQGQFEQTNALQRQQLDATERHRKVLEDQSMTDMDALSKATGIPLGTGRVSNTVANAALTTRQKAMERESEMAERERVAAHLDTLGRGTPGQTMPLSPGEDPEAAAFAARTPNMPGNSRAALLAPLVRLGKTGADLAKVLLPDDKTTEGDKRRTEIENYLRNVRKLTPGTEQYEREFMDWRNRPLTIFPGGSSTPMTEFVGAPSAGSPPAATPLGQGFQPTGRPTIVREPTPPPISTEQTVNLADFRTLLKQFDEVERAYATGGSKYVGPVAGRLGAVKGKTGIGANQPEADFRAGLASIQNSLIYLKSGKQINEQEYVRLSRELPDPSDPEPVFVAKLRRAKALMQTMLANREAEFKSRGYRGASPQPSAPVNNDPLGIRR